MLATNLSLEELLYLNGSITGGQYFETLIQTIAVTTKEKRFNTYSVPLFTGQFSELELEEDRMIYLHDFFVRRKGVEQGFLWKNPIDYTATHYREGVLDVDPGTYTVGGVMELPGQFLDKVTPAKIYVSDGFVTKKPIPFPIGQTVDLYEAGVYSRSAAVVDGQIDYYGNPNVLTLKMSFYTPTWFTQNELPSVIQGTGADDDGLYKINNISIKERLVSFKPVLDPQAN